MRACQQYGVIHTDVGFYDFGIDGAYDRRFDDPPVGTNYGTLNPARASENLGIGRGMLVDLRFGPSGYDSTNPLIIRHTDWEMIQLGWAPPTQIVC